MLDFASLCSSSNIGECKDEILLKLGKLMDESHSRYIYISISIYVNTCVYSRWSILFRWLDVYTIYNVRTPLIFCTISVVIPFSTAVVRN